jgi:hypothetical protein
MYGTNLYKKFSMAVNMRGILLALISMLVLNACAVPVKDAGTSHPANADAIVAPIKPMSKTLSDKPVKKTEEPMMQMDHSMHHMNQ